MPATLPKLPSTAQVLVVDDDAGVADQLCQYLGRFGFAAHAASGSAAMRACLATQRIDLMVLSLERPNGQGAVAAPSQVLAEGLAEGLAGRVRPGSSGRQRLPIIALSQHMQLIDRVIGLEMGADDYLAKPVEPRELVARIRAVLRRSRPLADAGATHAPAPTATARPAQQHFAGWTLDCHERRLRTPTGRTVPLSDAEFRLLSILLQTPRKVCSRAQLAAQARGRPAGDGGRSIDLLVSRLRLKLSEQAGAPSLIKTVRGAGYMLDVVVGLGGAATAGSPAAGAGRIRTGAPAAGSATGFAA